MTTDVSAVKHERVVSIDRFRGLCLLCMVVSFFLSVFGETFESWAKLFEHGEDGFQLLPGCTGDGLAFADLFAPAFIFIIGMTLVRSFSSREAKLGTDRAYFSVATRFLGLIGIGYMLNGIEDCWLKIWVDGKELSDIRISLRVLSVFSAIGIVLVLARIILSFIKNDKLQKIASDVLRYFFALTGVVGLFFFAVASTEVTNLYVFVGQREWKYGKPVWDTLENIGLAGLIALPFVKTSKKGRLTFVALVFIVMSIFAQCGGEDILTHTIEGGAFGAPMWASILLLGSVFYELRGTKRYYILAAVLILLPIPFIYGMDFMVAKRGCTPVYASICSGVAALVYALLSLFENKKFKFDVLTWWGGSAILIYILNYVVCLGIGAVLDSKELVPSIPVGLLFTLLALIVFTVINMFLYKKEKHIRI